MFKEQREYSPILVGNNANWEQYYRSDVASFKRSEGYYRSMLRELSKRSNLLSKSQRGTFLLGGFHPDNGTPHQFINFCNNIHPNPLDVHYLLDMNAISVSKIVPCEGIKPVLGKLEEMEFAGGSLDVVFLDGTVDYMEDGQLAGFVEKARDQLSLNGVVVIGKGYPTAINSMPRYDLTVNCYPRSLDRLINLMEPLIPIAFRTQPYRAFSYAAFSRPESIYVRALPTDFKLREEYNPICYNPLPGLLDKLH